MKIKCLPGKWFEIIKGTVLEEQVLARNKVVSIQSRSGGDSELPSSLIMTKEVSVVSTGNEKVSSWVYIKR